MLNSADEEKSGKYHGKSHTLKIITDGRSESRRSRGERRKNSILTSDRGNSQNAPGEGEGEGEGARAGGGRDPLKLPPRRPKFRSRASERIYGGNSAEPAGSVLTSGTTRRRAGSGPFILAAVLYKRIKQRAEKGGRGKLL